MFYDKFAFLCRQKGVSPSRAAIEAGISKSLVTKWKTNNIQDPSPDVVRKLSNYFNVSISELLGEDTKKAPANNGKRAVSDDEIKFALFRGREDITDAMFEEVLNFADYVARREEEKKRKD